MPLFGPGIHGEEVGNAGNKEWRFFELPLWVEMRGDKIRRLDYPHCQSLDRSGYSVCHLIRLQTENKKNDMGLRVA